MAMTVHCDIVSSEEQVFSGLIESLTATGFEGELGVQYGHAALLTPLRPGAVEIVKQGGEREVIYVRGGYLEVQPNLVTVLADTAIRASSIDAAAADEARRAALHEIQNRSGELEFSRASSELAEASAQLMALEKLRRKMKAGA